MTEVDTIRSEPDDAGARSVRSRRVRHFALVVVVVVVGVLALSRLNPLLAIGVENRLERACSVPTATSRYERSSWTPLRWTCVLEHHDGTEELIGPWKADQ